MFEKVNPGHPDKVADRIAGAIVDLCYTKSKNPKVACEVLIGHGECNIQVETSEQISAEDIEAIVERIAGEDIVTRALIVPQDSHLAANQRQGVRCGDNGIFKGVPPTHEQKLLTAIAASIYGQHPFDGKYIIRRESKDHYELSDKLKKLFDDGNDAYYQLIAFKVSKRGKEMTDRDREKLRDLEIKHRTLCQKFSEESDKEFKRREREEPYYLTICQSHLSRGQEPELREHLKNAYGIHLPTINPLGEWTGGPNTDSGATNRKLGSDMGDGVSGGGINGKDLSKGDVSINIVSFLKAVQSGQTVTACCSIGDEHVTFQYASGKTETETFADVVEMARLYILTDCNGSFETFSEWGLIRPKP